MTRLTLIGLGISDEKGVSLSGIERMKEPGVIFAELFTSVLSEGSLKRLSAIVGKEITVLSREEVEEQDLILSTLESGTDVCFLTAGDPLTATTHQDLRLRALKADHTVDIINSASIYVAAAGLAGLQHYKFGRTTTLPYPEGDYLPTSPLEVITENLEQGFHTLVLLDIQAHLGRYMTAPEGCKVLLMMAGKAGGDLIGPSTMVVAVLRAGRVDSKVVYGPISVLKDMDLGPPPHCLIVPGKLHFMEEEMLSLFRVGEGR